MNNLSQDLSLSEKIKTLGDSPMIDRQRLQVLIALTAELAKDLDERMQDVEARTRFTEPE